MGRVGLVGALGLKVLRVHERIINPLTKKGKKRKGNERKRTGDKKKKSRKAKEVNIGANE